ncbi:MAG TPA: hypothetical protein PLY93_08980 [Turneriella sp.]|nr:hypothetical protein [Turneriella sp.]
MFKKYIVFFIFFFSLNRIEAKLYLLLDEELRNNKVEQVIYKFVPLTSAQEVELDYVKDFLREERAVAFAERLKKGDHAIYIGSDEWPKDAYIDKLAKDKAYQQKTENITFLVKNAFAQESVQLPKGFFDRSDLWRKYAEFTHHAYAGRFSLHYLDSRPNVPKAGDWSYFTCVHESGRVMPSQKAPIFLSKKEFRLNFKTDVQLAFLGHLICINTPKANAIFEVDISKTDIQWSVEASRFSFWNEAVPIRFVLNADKPIYAPLELEFIPEVNETQTEFFFQGERITCTSKRCRKKSARFLLPQFENTHAEFIVAVRALPDAYFRGTVRLLAGSLELQRVPLVVRPHSWVAELTYALKNPSEYRNAFVFSLIGVVFALLLFYYSFKLIRRRIESVLEQRRKSVAKQTNAAVAIEKNSTVFLTASKNPFGCELYGFGSVVTLRIGEEAATISYAQTTETLPLEQFLHRLPDGYVLTLKKNDSGGLTLDAALLAKSIR